MAGRRPHRAAVQAVDRQAGRGIAARGDLALGRRVETVFGAEQRHKLGTGRLVQHVDRPPSRRIARRAVGYEPDPASRQLAKAIGFEHVDARQHVRLLAARRGARDLGDPPQHRQDVALAVGMQPVGEHDQEGFGLGVDPDRRAGIAGVAVGARREGGREPHGVGRIDVPAQAAQGGPAGRALRRRHRRDGGRLQHALAARQHHLRELGEVVGGGEHAGLARDAAHAIGERIVDVAPAQLGALEVGRGDAVLQRSRRQEGGVAHAERLEDVLGAVDLQRLARHAPHDLAQHDEIDVAVVEARAGGRQRLERDDGVERALVVRPSSRRDTGRQAGIMGHELADGDVALAVGREGRPVGGGRPVEIDLPALDELLMATEVAITLVSEAAS